MPLPNIFYTNHCFHCSQFSIGVLLRPRKSANHSQHQQFNLTVLRTGSLVFDAFIWSFMLSWSGMKQEGKPEHARYSIYGTHLGHLGIQPEQGNCLTFATCRTSHIIILSDIAFSEAVSEPFSIARSEPSNEQEDAYDIVQAMQEVQLQAHAAPHRPVDTSGWVTTVMHV